MRSKIDEVEKAWPRFQEGPGQSREDASVWGDHRFGRVAPFIWADSGQDYGALQTCTLDTAQVIAIKKAGRERLLADAAQYRTQFNQALQENQLCAQHHMHKKDAATGKRILPNAY